MIVLITDFGLSGPYLGQMQAVLHRAAPGVPVINLFADAPVHNPKATAYLLAAYAPVFPPGSIFLTVVDPGVGSGGDAPVVARAAEKWFVGPDNGVFDIASRRGREPCQWWRIAWRPPAMSSSFHGRDLYAPVAARLANEDLSGLTLLARRATRDWPDNLFEIVYIDHFGNAMTGVFAGALGRDAVLSVHRQPLRYAQTFASVGRGQPFWYENANGLIEIAVNQGRADQALNLRIGDGVQLQAS